jgi:hypothetical protein
MLSYCYRSIYTDFAAPPDASSRHAWWPALSNVMSASTVAMCAHTLSAIPGWAKLLPSYRSSHTQLAVTRVMNHLCPRIMGLGLRNGDGSYFIETMGSRLSVHIQRGPKSTCLVARAAGARNICVGIADVMRASGVRWIRRASADGKCYVQNSRSRCASCRPRTSCKCCEHLPRAARNKGYYLWTSLYHTFKSESFEELTYENR